MIEITPDKIMVLPESITIADSEVLHQALEDALQSSELNGIDATRVSRVDTTALQLLLAFRRDAADTGHAVGWTGVSETLKEAAKQLGLENLLEVA